MNVTQKRVSAALPEGEMRPGAESTLRVASLADDQAVAHGWRVRSTAQQLVMPVLDTGIHAVRPGAVVGNEEQDRPHLM